MSKSLKIFLAILTSLLIVIILMVLLFSRPLFLDGMNHTNDAENDHFIDIANVKQHVLFLSETSLPRDGRHHEKLNMVADYINKQFSSFSSNTSFQDYKVDGNDYKNVITTFGPETEDIIIVGAHYDAYGNLPGADDNASGVAGLIELGRLLSKADLKQQVVLVAYTLEEPPYYATKTMGSYVHAESLKSLKNKKVKLMISLEMIGYFTDEEGSQDFPIQLMKLRYPDTGNFILVVDKMMSNHGASLKSSINKHTDLPAYSLNAPRNLKGVDFSDHRSYWKFDYPAVMVTDTAFYRNKAYHTAQDTHDRLNYESLADVVYGVFKHVQKLSNED